MPGREHLVCFTRYPPFDVQPNQLVFYDVVDVSTTAKSGVLSTIADAGGEARLPDAVTLSDFKLWISVSDDNYINFNNLSFLDLCTVVKVADALDDHDVVQWNDLAAERLVLLAASDPSEISPDSIDCALSTLAEAAQHRSFSVAASAPRHLYSLLSFLPPHYHTSVVAAAVTADKALSLPFSRDSIPALKVLTALPQSPSSVLSLHSHGPETSPSAFAKRDGFSIAGYLLQALQHHTHLTEVRVSSRNITAASAELLIPGIACLKSLQALHLGGEGRPFPAASVPLLQQALSSLRRLQCLNLVLSVFPNAGVKRPRESEAAPDPHCCLAAVLSPATALTSLHISIVHVGRRSWHRATIPLELPHLRLLSIIVGPEDWPLTTDFINHLRADHLTSLELEVPHKRADWYRLPGSSVAGAHRFVDRLAHFSQLRHLTVALPCDAAEVGVPETDVMDMMRSLAPAVLASLKSLQQLSIAAEPSVLCCTVPALAASLTAVTCLELHSVSDWRRASIDVPIPDMCTSLCQMNLKSLSVIAMRTETGMAGLAALRLLTQLSALCVDGWDCLETAADCEALAGMTSLRRLELLDCFVECQPAAAVHALLALSALTELTVGHAGEAREELNELLVVELCNHDAQAAWPALRELCLYMYLSDDYFPSQELVVRWSLELPALEKLIVDLPADREADERRSEDVVEDQHDDVFDLEKIYRRIAAEAGVEIERLLL